MTITSRPATDEYRMGWDRIFGKQDECPDEQAPVIYEDVVVTNPEDIPSGVVVHTKVRTPGNE